MRLDAVLKKIDVEIVKTENTQNRVVIYLRTGKDRRSAERWKKVVEETLMACHEQKKTSWHVDLSKAFFVDRGAVKYLWRVVLTGDVKKGAENLGNAVMRSVSQGVEVTSMPLVGRISYPFDPANGKMKGAHDPQQARRAISIGVSGGHIQ